MILSKLFRSKGGDSAGIAESDLTNQVPIKRGAEALELFESLRRKGDNIPGWLYMEVGDCHRQLGKSALAEEMYRAAAVCYVKDEGWTHAAAAVRKASKVAGQNTAALAILTLQIALGRGQADEACRALDDLSRLLAPSEGETIEQIIAIVDNEPLAEPEVEIALSEMLTVLGRPDRAIERLRAARLRAIRAGRTSMAADLENRLREVEGESQPATTAPIRSRVTSPAAPMPPLGGAAVAMEAEPIPKPVALPDPPEPSVDPVADSPVFIAEPEPQSSPVPMYEKKSSPDSDWELPPIPIWESLPPLESPTIEGPSENETDLPVTLHPAEDPAPAPQPAGDVDFGFDMLGTHPFATDDEEESGVWGNRSEDDSQNESAEPYVRLADLRERKTIEQGRVRIVGTDGREEHNEEQAQVQHLMTALLDGLRAAVPADEVDTHYQLGLSFLQMEMFDEAIEKFQVAFRSPELRKHAAEGLAQSFLGRGDAFLAHRVARMMIEELNADDSAILGLLYWQARAAEDLERREEAIDLYERVAVHDAAFMDALQRLRALQSGG